VCSGESGAVKAVKFSSGQLGRGLVRHGLFRRSRYGLICRGFGVARRSSQGEARYHMEGCGEVCRSGFGAFRFSSVRFEWAGHGGQGRVGHVRVCRNMVRLGKASARRSWKGEV